MADLHFNAQTAAVACAATTKKTVLQLVAGTNTRIKVSEVSVSFDGTTNTDTPVLVQVLRQTDAGTGGDALTLQKVNEDDAETLQSSALKDIDSSEPTGTNELFGEYVHPQGGYTWQAPFSKEWIIKGGNRLGVAITAPDAVNVKARFAAEE